MFNKREFNAMLARAGMTKAELAKALGMNTDKLYRRLRAEDFLVSEVQKMIEIFGEEEVIRVFFNA